MGTLKTINIKHASAAANVNNIVLSSDGSTTFHNISNLQTGKIIQCKTAVKLDTVSSDDTDYSEISTDLRITITPTSATSKIIVNANLYMHTEQTMSLRLLKKETSAGSSWTMVNTPTTFSSNNDGNAAFYAGNTARPLMVTPLQVIETAGSTNERYYSPHWRIDVVTGGHKNWLNKYDDTHNSGWNGTSSMTIMEVAA